MPLPTGRDSAHSTPESVEFRPLTSEETSLLEETCKKLQDRVDLDVLPGDSSA